MDTELEELTDMFDYRSNIGNRKINCSPRLKSYFVNDAAKWKKELYSYKAQKARKMNKSNVK